MLLDHAPDFCVRCQGAFAQLPIYNRVGCAILLRISVDYLRPDHFLLQLCSMCYQLLLRLIALLLLSTLVH